MKKFVLATAIVFLGSASVALAADMAIKAPAPVPVVSTWTGFYAGLNGGWGWADQNDWTFGNTLIGSGGTPSGGLFGGQVGYNWQMNNLLVGVQLDGDWANIKGTAGNPLNLRDGRCGFNGTPDQSVDCITKYKGMANLTTRFGFLPAPDTLIYGKVGINWSSIDFSITNDIGNSGTCGPVPGTPHPGYNTNNISATGLTAGLGVEQRVWDKVTVFGEYDVVQSGSGSTNNFWTGGTGTNGCTANFGPSTTTLKPLNIVKFGINYQFH